jgi:hypothetical protein
MTEGRILAAALYICVHFTHGFSSINMLILERIPRFVVRKLPCSSADSILSLLLGLCVWQRKETPLQDKFTSLSSHSNDSGVW